MNKCLFSGRFTRDPQVSYSKGDNTTAIARFSIAVDRRFKRDGEDQTADFPRFVAFGKQGEFVEKYMRKGTKVIIVSHFQDNKYTNKEGQKVSSYEFVVDEIEFAESKNSASSTPAPALDESADDGFMDIPDGFDENLPFE